MLCGLSCFEYRQRIPMGPVLMIRGASTLRQGYFGSFPANYTERLNIRAISIIVSGRKNRNRAVSAGKCLSAVRPDSTMSLLFPGLN